MSDQPHKDNLEKFFRSNLENYSPTPSGDFWAKMEHSIPPKPSAWGGWGGLAAKWMAAAAVIGLVAVAGITWHKDRQEIARLANAVEKLQKKIDRASLKHEQATHGGNEAAGSPNPDQATTAVGPAALGEAPAAGAPQASASRQLPTSATGKHRQTQKSRRADKKQKIEYEAPGIARTDNQHVSKNNAMENTPLLFSQENVDKIYQDSLNVDSIFARGQIELLSWTPSKTLKSNDATQHALSVQFGTPKGENPYPRFSFECGASAFLMPVRRLFQADTTLLETGKARASSAAGITIDFELKPALAFQTGFHFKQVRAEKLALRYNSFPFSLRKQWAWGRRGRIEALTGVSINTLFNARTPTDGVAVQGLHSTWLGWHGGLRLCLPISQKMNLVAGPALGYSLTPVANNHRTWEAGLGASLRYQIW